MKIVLVLLCIDTGYPQAVDGLAVALAMVPSEPVFPLIDGQSTPSRPDTVRTRTVLSLPRDHGRSIISTPSFQMRACDLVAGSER
jgi:hypothetical protein